ncbi:phage tail protein, partial [Chryseobacterium sp.]|uniref:phage tail protein n=1 Tax=Chryseobacterium sp. TaxID=1871047 RepID=UPI0035AEFF83
TALGTNRNAVKIETGIPIEATPDDEFKTDLWLHGGESFSAAFYGGKLYLIGGNIHLENIGEVRYGYTPQSFSLPANGTLVNRADFPRLWQMVSKYSKIVTDSQWLNGSGLNSGYFSSGNGTSTFRVPDLRGLFIRGLDGGRGIDLDRNSANIQDGSFQADALKKHKHLITDVHPYDGFALLGGGFNGGANNFKWRNTETQEAGTYETRPQNIALTPYIRF